MPAAGALANVDPQDIIQRYLADERTPDIAASLGVHRSALNQMLLRDCPDDWRKAQAARAVTALDDAKLALESAPNSLSLARAREQLRSAQWELERLLRRLYGDHLQVGGDVDVHVHSDRGQVLLEAARAVAYILQAGNGAPQLPQRVIEIIDAETPENGVDSGS